MTFVTPRCGFRRSRFHIANEVFHRDEEHEIAHLWIVPGVMSTPRMVSLQTIVGLLAIVILVAARDVSDMILSLSGVQHDWIGRIISWVIAGGAAVMFVVWGPPRRYRRTDDEERKTR
jgi:predicted GTPase